MKPIVRWTIGKTTEAGLACLKYSVKQWQKLYGDKFECFVCYNEIDGHRLADIPCEKLNQKLHCNSLDISPKRLPCWKLYPPRIDIDRHEVFVDNDLVLHRKPDLVERFLGTNRPFISQALVRFYGAFMDIAPQQPMNTGLFGLPPGYDFRSKINELIKQRSFTTWAHHADEQGVVAVLLKEADIIPLSDIYVCLNNYKLGRCGMHFVGLNSGEDTYWLRYRKLSLL